MYMRTHESVSLMAGEWNRDRTNRSTRHRSSVNTQKSQSVDHAEVARCSAEIPSGRAYSCVHLRAFSANCAGRSSISFAASIFSGSKGFAPPSWSACERSTSSCSDMVTRAGTDTHSADTVQIDLKYIQGKLFETNLEERNHAENHAREAECRRVSASVPSGRIGLQIVVANRSF